MPISSSAFLLLIFIVGCILRANGEPLEDKPAMLDFVSSFPRSVALNWTDETRICDQGPLVVCNAARTRVTMVRFDSIGLRGVVPANTISRLSELRTLILSSNRLVGNFPSDFANLQNLIHLDLHSNNFSGPLPGDFSIWKNLTVVDLSNNAFTGTIPSSLAKLPNLSLLNLSNNHLQVDFHRKESMQIVYAFCGVSIMICLCARRKRRSNSDDMSETRSVSTNPKPVPFEVSNYRFDLTALLHSSTEILGSSRLGTSYKVVLDNSVSVVVKSLKDVGESKGRFKQAMEMVQRIQHENVASLKGYYYSNDIKLMLYEYYRQGSLASILHGTTEGSQVRLNWATRVRIALGAAKGLAFIHLFEGGTLAHNNIKSSNIFLTSDNQSTIVSDLGQVSVTSALPPPVAETIGNRAPEGMFTWKAGQPADVYSFGVVLLELLTRKSPIFSIGSGVETSTLVMWVGKVITEEWTGDVFDPGLMGDPSVEVEVEAEMVEMLHIAMMCIKADPDDRPEMAQVVTMIEGIRESG